MRGIEPRAFHMQSERSTTELHPLLSYTTIFLASDSEKLFAPGEARTHGLQIMRLTRCLLRYGGKISVWQTNSLRLNIGCHRHKKIVLPTGGLEPPIFGLGDRRLIH